MKKNKGVKGKVGINIELHKAYDQVNWHVLLHMLDAHGFNEKFNLLIFRCMSSVKLKMLLNGSCYGSIPMERGIQQGDPISPFLFVIFLELIFRMLAKLKNDGDIQGIKIGRTAPPISHLFFTNDIFIFCKASVDQTTKVINCLEKSYSWTSQSFNPMKIGCFFSNNIHGSLKPPSKVASI